MNMTLDYYAENAESFAESTFNVDFSETQDRFLAKLPTGCKILDFGCGAGRDTRRFLAEGFAVEAVDGSEELCRIASENTGIPVRRMLFQELDVRNEYDGIWACASILHLPGTELADVLAKMERALKPGGVIYTSFKEGEFEGERNGRYFSFFTAESFRKFIDGWLPLTIEDVWNTGDVRQGRGGERWLNLILRKK